MTPGQAEARLSWIIEKERNRSRDTEEGPRERGLRGHPFPRPPADFAKVRGIAPHSAAWISIGSPASVRLSASLRKADSAWPTTWSIL